MMKHFLLLNLLIFFVLGTSLAQQRSCTELLEDANEAFQEGRIEDIPRLTLDCIKSAPTRDQLSQAYKLLTITYLYDNELEEADSTMLELLRLNPLFRPDLAADPGEFIHLYNSFRTTPILKVGVNVGANSLLIDYSKSFGIENHNTSTESYSSNIGVVLGLAVEYPIQNSRWSATADLNYMSRSFLLENSLLAFNNSKKTVSQSWIDLPITAKYLVKDEGTFQPYAQLGFTVNYLFSDGAKIDIKQEEIKDIESPQLDLIDTKNKLHFGLTGAVGAEYHFGVSIIQLSAHFQYTFSEMVKPESRDTPLAKSLLYNYGEIENDYKLHTFYLSAGYKLKIFNPKKLTE